MTKIQENLKNTEMRIAGICQRVGRNPDEVTLIAVSKTKPVSDIREAMDFGMKNFGENKVQELRDKTKEITEPLNWHMIGHLQTNKVHYLPGIVSMIHSVDNLKLAETIEKEFAKQGERIDVLCEVNMAREDTKFGLSPEEVLDFVRSIRDFPHLNIRGLMTIAPFTQDPEENRPYFRGLRELKDEINRQAILEKPMDTLSMGMTNDYEIAVEEGATLVRVGTGIFGERNYQISES